tara:strand:- start:694 stop:1968 length:1275 start_codon:yes stop_codon:yes gene_type:complete
MSLQLPRGTKDFAPEEKILRDEIVNTLKEVFELYGYAPLETPTFERFEVLSSKYAGGDEILKETFRFKDQGSRELALRYDLTVPFSRFIAMNPNLKMPFKRYQIGEVYRDGPIASSRYRQFLQCDVDVVGSSSMVTDADIVSLTNDVFKKLKLDVIIKINNRKLLNDILSINKIDKNDFDTVILSLDKLEKFGEKVVKEELKKKKIEEESIKKILELISIKGENNDKIKKLDSSLKESEGLKEIKELINYLEIMGVEFVFDVSLARGLSYYTGTVFEIVLKDSKIKSSISGGGRYDKMIGSLVGRGEFPAVGISFGIDRIYDALKEVGVELKKTPTKIYLIPINTRKESMGILKQLRDNGINSDIDLLGKGISKNLQYANSLRIPFVLIIGENELNDKKLKLKDMESGDEESLSVDEIISKVLS